jgi:hypothetical protein
LIDIESISWNEGAAGRWLRNYLADAGFEVTTQTVTGDRINVYARVGDPVVTFSSHMDIRLARSALRRSLKWRTVRSPAHTAATVRAGRLCAIKRL